MFEQQEKKLYERISKCDYQDARQAFLDAVTKAGVTQVESYKLPYYVGPDDKDLFMDVAEIGDKDASNVIVISSGTHGPEGYYGSVLQQDMLKKIADESLTLPKDTKILMVHAINPFGMAWHSRFDQDNVDLNRNDLKDINNPDKNEGYESYHDYVSKNNWTLDSLKTAVKLPFFLALKKSGINDGPLEQAKVDISGGQYTHPDGIFYGGCRQSWSHETLIKVVQEYTENAKRCIYVDLHTGLGSRGVIEAIAGPLASDEAHYALTKAVFPEATSKREGSSVSTLETNHLRTTMMNAVSERNPKCEITGVAFEAGTVPASKVGHALTEFNRVWANAAKIYASYELKKDFVTQEEIYDILTDQAKAPECFKAAIKPALLESKAGIAGRNAVLEAFFLKNDPEWYERIIDGSYEHINKVFDYVNDNQFQSSPGLNR